MSALIGRQTGRQRKSLLCNHTPWSVVRTDGGNKSALQHDKLIQRLCCPRLDRKVRTAVCKRLDFYLLVEDGSSLLCRR